MKKTISDLFDQLLDLINWIPLLFGWVLRCALNAAKISVGFFLLILLAAAWKDWPELFHLLSILSAEEARKFLKGMGIGFILLLPAVAVFRFRYLPIAPFAWNTQNSGHHFVYGSFHSEKPKSDDLTHENK